MPGDRPLPFLDRLRESGLLTAAQLKELSLLPESGDLDPRALGLQTLKRGWLTRFQINVIAKGRSQDLTFGPYVLLDSLGEGAMGQVFKAHHQRMGRVVALKVIRKDKLAGPAAVQRFYQEVRAAAQLSHPNIVIAYDADSIGGTHYLAMEYVDGIDLARLVKESGPLSTAVASDFIRQAAQGLQHSHERGLVHRDIKPHNLLVTRSKDKGTPTSATSNGNPQTDHGGVVKILDMGLARRQGLDEKARGVTQDGAVIGTPDYLAPEQAVDARSADIRADLYSLGCTFYFLLTGRPPFQAESLTELLLKHQLEQPVPLEQRRADVPPAVAAIVRKLMAKRPEDRYQTPAELLSALTLGKETAAMAAPLVREPAVERAGPWDSLADDRPLPTRETEATAVLVAARQSPRSLSRATTVATHRARRGVPWWVLALPGSGLLAAAFTITVVVWRPGRANNEAKENPSSAALPKPAAPPKNQDPPDAQEDPPALGKDKERPAGAQQPPRTEDAGAAAAARPPVVPQQGAPPRTVGELRRFDRQDGPITAIAATSDGRTAVVAAANQSVWVWDVESGKLRHDLPFRYPAPIESLAVNPDASQLIAIYQGNLHFWDLANLRATVRPSTGRYLSPDGQFSLGLEGPEGKQVARLSDLAKEKELCRFTNAPSDATSVAIVPECQRLVVGSAGGEVYICDWKTTKWRKWQLEREGAVTVALAGQGHLLATSSQAFGICVWETDTGKFLRRLEGQPASPGALAISGDGRLVLAGNQDGLIRLWHTGSGRVIREYQGHTGAVTRIVMLPGEQFLSGGDDTTMRLWRLFPANNVVAQPQPKPADPPPTTDRPLRRLEGAHKNPVMTMTFVPRAGTLLAAGGEGITSWNWTKGQLLGQMPATGHYIHCFALSPDGRLGISGSLIKSARFWDMKAGKPQRDLPGQSAAVLSVAFSADGKKALLGSGAAAMRNAKAEVSKCAVRVWDVTRMQELCRFEGHTSGVKFAAFLLDGRHVLSCAGGPNDRILIWDANTGKEVRRLAESVNSEVGGVALSPDGRYLLLGYQGVARLWDVEKDQEARRLAGHRGFVLLAAFSGDGKYVLTADLHGGAEPGDFRNAYAIHLWEVATGRELRRYPMHPEYVQSIVFSPDCRHILSGYNNGTILVWETGIKPAKP